MGTSVYPVTSHYSVTCIIHGYIAARVQVISTRHDDSDIFHIMHFAVLYGEAIHISGDGQRLTRSGVYIIDFTFFDGQVTYRSSVIVAYHQECMRTTPVTVVVSRKAGTFYIIDFAVTESDVSRYSVDIYPFGVGVDVRIRSVADMQIFKGCLLYTSDAADD